jgi:hypothetical protein
MKKLQTIFIVFLMVVFTVYVSNFIGIFLKVILNK